MAGELQIDAPSTETWSPVSSSNRFYPGGHPFGSLLPLLYSQLVTIDADDFANAHRTNVGGDLATGWEWPDDTTVLFQLHEGVSWPEMAPVDGRALTAEDVKVAHDALRVPKVRARRQRMQRWNRSRQTTPLTSSRFVSPARRRTC